MNGSACHRGLCVVVLVNVIGLLCVCVCVASEMTDFAKLHACVVSVATAQSCSHSRLTPKNVSVHVLPETTSFSSVAALAGAVPLIYTLAMVTEFAEVKNANTAGQQVEMSGASPIISLLPIVTLLLLQGVALFTPHKNS